MKRNSFLSTTNESNDSIDSIDNGDDKDAFDTKTFETILSTTLSLIKGAHENAGANILKAQEKQQRDYNRRHVLPASIKAKDKVWLKNQKRLDRKRWEIFIQIDRSI